MVFKYCMNYGASSFPKDAFSVYPEGGTAGEVIIDVSNKQGFTMFIKYSVFHIIPSPVSFISCRSLRPLFNLWRIQTFI